MLDTQPTKTAARTVSVVDDLGGLRRNPIFDGFILSGGILLGSLGIRLRGVS